MLKIEAPNTYLPEREYIFSVILGEFWGLDFKICFEDRLDIRISSEEKKELLLADHLFAFPKDRWLQPDSLPSQPLNCWEVPDWLEDMIINRNIPVIYGKDPREPQFFRISEKKIQVGLDIFGSAFFMLSRYEEPVKKDRDKHDRFPGTASLAFQESFLGRPIINEYLEILWGCLKRLWPNLKRKKRCFRIFSSHDVDFPFKYRLRGPWLSFRILAGDIRKKKARITAQWLKMNQIPIGDPYNTFDLIMDIGEENNLKCAFFFLAENLDPIYDGNYSIRHPLIRKLLKRINSRGHEIGLHASYHTYLDSRQTAREFDILKKVCEQEGISQTMWGGRQHILRWKTPTTFQNWEEAGLDYDSSLVFADRPGFRCGICYEFPAFNLLTKKKLRLRERPLVVMDAGFMDYLGLEPDDPELLNSVLGYKELCKRFQGDFTLLWHNNRLDKQAALENYRCIISS